MMPYIITHNAVSIDGRLDWIEPDLGLYYKIASECNEDATLVGSGTMLAAPTDDKKEKSVFEKPSYDPDDNRHRTCRSLCI